MDRRMFLQSLSASLMAGTVTGAPVLAAGDSWKAEFQTALQSKPWLLGYLGTQATAFHEQDLPVEGTLPPELTGTLYRNGPARHEIGDMRYQHWFDGDGMVHAFRFGEGRVSHKARMVETAKFRRETEAGRALVHGFGTALPGLERPSAPDDRNVANINLTRHNGELLALWEGGSAYRLDPETLDTLGLKSWSKQTAGAPFSAHPRVDQDGTLWNFGYAATFGALLIYRISPDGQLRDTGVLPMQSVPMVHDFVITDRHLVLFLAPFRFDTDLAGAFLDRFAWRPDEGAQILVIDKNDLNAVQTFDAPPYWIFHYANGFTDDAGRIQMSAPVYDTPAIMTDGFREVMRGREGAFPGAAYMTMTLDPASGRLDTATLPDLTNAEFPRIDPRRQATRNGVTYTMQARNRGINQGFDTLVRIDHQRERLDTYGYPDTEMAEEHVFVPHPDSTAEQKGWVVGTSLDIAKRHSVLYVFNAEHIADGPVARMPLPMAIPLGLHGNFYT
ncbi:MAG: carotenoid oxygenase family protein [Paracoccaceae bacterium]